MRLVIAEKPSVARDLARVLGVRGQGRGCLVGSELVITWCVGHLVELQEPAHYDDSWQRWSLDTLPMVPPAFELRPRKGASDQWVHVERLLRDPRFEGVVNACDAGREGELIFRYAYELAGAQMPVQRLWLASMTDAAITQAWARLRPGSDLDPLADAARCRSEADWLVGLNATRAMTCLARNAGGDELLSVGRVQTPTLAMIVERDRAIEAFVPEPFWQVKATFSVKREGEDPTWQATWFRPSNEKEQEGEVPQAERLPDAATADRIAELTRGRQGVLETAERKRVKDPAPLLYDLTELQRRANQRYGFAADRTLEIAQALYEKHKLLTYPRTDARYLTPDQVPELPEVVRAVGTVPVYAEVAGKLLEHPIKPGKRVVDASEVGDHHAILPTSKPPGSGLSADEKRIYDLVARRLLAALVGDALLEKAVIVVAVAVDEADLPEGIEAPLRYRARGRVIVEPGWRAIDPPGRNSDKVLPELRTDEPAHADEVEVAEGQTRPPRPYDDASLLKAMETAGRDLDDAALKRAMRGQGLGTPATRAAMIQTLIARQYVRREKKAILATDRGCALIDAISVDELKSAELTGRWEARLARMEAGKEARAAFMADVVERLGQVIVTLRGSELPAAAITRRANDNKPLGTCPLCGTVVKENRAAYTCESGRACAFVVFKTMSKRAISPTMVKKLLEDKRTQVVKGFKSKQGKPFEAGLLLQEDGRVGFWFPDREPPHASSERAPPAGPRLRTPVGLPCPECGQGRVIAGKAAWGCSRWREGCGYRLAFEGLTPEEAAQRITSGS